MNKRLLLYLLVIWSALLSVGIAGYALWRAADSSMNVLPQSASIIAAPFDISMRRSEFSELFLKKGDNAQVYRLFQLLYERNGPHMDPPPRRKNRKIVHHIWLGGALPEKYAEFVKSWKKFHPDWEHRFWDDEALSNFPMQNRALYDASTNYGERSDIARYEILNAMGGLYVDTDYEALQPIDSIHDRYDFYIGIQPLDVHRVQLGTGLIGCIPGHPLIKAAIKAIPEQKTRQIISRTGPIFFSRIFLQEAGKHEAVCAFPASYFYPMGYKETVHDRAVWERPESYAVHHWAGSWLAPEATIQ